MHDIDITEGLSLWVGIYSIEEARSAALNQGVVRSNDTEVSDGFAFEFNSPCQSLTWLARNLSLSYSHGVCTLSCADSHLTCYQVTLVVEYQVSRLSICCSIEGESISRIAINYIQV